MTTYIINISIIGTIYHIEKKFKSVGAELVKKNMKAELFYLHKIGYIW